MQNTQKNQSEFFDNAAYTPLQNWVVSVLKKMYPEVG